MLSLWLRRSKPPSQPLTLILKTVNVAAGVGAVGGGVAAAEMGGIAVPSLVPRAPYSRFPRLRQQRRFRK
jgi:hypothetical protein